MKRLPDRSRRVLQFGGLGLALTLVALGTAAWALVRAEAERGRRSADRRAERWAQEVLVAATRDAVAADGVTWFGLDAAFRVVEPASGRAFDRLPEAVDEEGAFFAAQVAAGGPEAQGAGRLALASEDSVVRLHAALALVDKGGDPVDLLARARIPASLARTRDALLLRLRAGEQTAVVDALAAIGSADEDAAAALLLGAGMDHGLLLVRGRRMLLGDARRLAALVMVAPPSTAGGEERVLVMREGALVVATPRRPDSVGEADAAWWVAHLPAATFADAAERLHAPDARVLAPGQAPRPGEPTYAFPGTGGFRATASPDPWAVKSTLLIGGFSLAAMAAVAAFVAFSRGVLREARLARLRAEFVATVGHELRTPVAVIRSSAEALALGRATRDEDRERLVDGIVRESERLSGLLGNVLDFARMEAGRRRFSPTACEVETVVRDTVEAHRAALDRANVTVDIDVADDVPVLCCDRDALGAALVNLLDNAAKFSGDRRDVHVRARREGTHVALEVVDHGRGVPDAEKVRVFERFFRGAADDVQETRGTGIGLALVRHAAEAHDGRVEVEDTDGGGATFRMLLPIDAHGGG